MRIARVNTIKVSQGLYASLPLSGSGKEKESRRRWWIVGVGRGRVERRCVLVLTVSVLRSVVRCARVKSSRNASVLLVGSAVGARARFQHYRVGRLEESLRETRRDTVITFRYFWEIIFPEYRSVKLSASVWKSLYIKVRFISRTVCIRVS